MSMTTITRIWHLLLVEDEPGDVQLVREAIGLRQVHLHVVNTVMAAIHYLERRTGFTDAPAPDLILLDLGLPLFSGAVLLEERRRHGLWLDVPIVVYSSSDQGREDSLMHGAVAFACKPCIWQEWQRFMNDLIERYLS